MEPKKPAFERITITVPREDYEALLVEVTRRKLDKAANASVSALVSDLIAKGLKHIASTRGQ